MALTLEFIKNMIGNGIFFSSDRATIEYLLEKDTDPLTDSILLVSEEQTKLIAPDGLLEHKIENRKIFVDEKKESIWWVNFFQERHNILYYVSDVLYEQSLIKSATQLANIKKALGLNASAYNAVVKQICAGMSELDIFSIIKKVYYKNTGENIEFISDVIAGKRTALVSGSPTDYKVAKQDAVILDLLPKYNGIYCDTTRTIFLDAPSKKQEEIYNILTEAIAAGREILKPGVCAGDVYNRVKNQIKKYGYDIFFPHHAGHGFGRTIFERPYFLPKERTELKENMVVTLEPGIYLPDKFGIRLEDNYLITETGSELLGNIPMEIEAYIA